MRSTFPWAGPAPTCPVCVSAQVGAWGFSWGGDGGGQGVWPSGPETRPSGLRSALPDPLRLSLEWSRISKLGHILSVSLPISCLGLGTHPVKAQMVFPALWLHGLCHTPALVVAQNQLQTL